VMGTAASRWQIANCVMAEAHSTTSSIPIHGAGRSGLNLNWATRTTSFYARLFGGQSSAIPGSYSSKYAGSTHRRLYYQYCLGGPSTCPACGTLANRDDAPSFIVSATVASNCVVSATTLNFGTTGSLAADVDATNTIAVRCTPGPPWTATLNSGS